MNSIHLTDVIEMKTHSVCTRVIWYQSGDQLYLSLVVDVGSLHDEFLDALIVAAVGRHN